jgi:hypothetical protein
VNVPVGALVTFAPYTSEDTCKKTKIKRLKDREGRKKFWSVGHVIQKSPKAFSRIYNYFLFFKLLCVSMLFGDAKNPRMTSTGQYIMFMRCGTESSGIWVLCTYVRSFFR